MLRETHADGLPQIEYLVVLFDDEKRNVKLSLRQADILAALAANAEMCEQQSHEVPSIVPEPTV